MQAMDVNAITGRSQRKMPWDVRTFGVVCYVGAGLCFANVLYLLARVLMPSYPVRPQDKRVILFGVLIVATPLWVGIYGFVSGVIAVLQGYSLRRGHALGWWLWMIGVFSSFAFGISKVDTNPWWAVWYFFFSSLCFAWGIFRIAIYRPFGKGSSGH